MHHAMARVKSAGAICFAHKMYSVANLRTGGRGAFGALSSRAHKTQAKADRKAERSNRKSTTPRLPLVVDKG